MSTTVSYGSLCSFLADRVDPHPSPTADPTGLCLLAGGIVGRNLEEALIRRGVPTGGIAISTIEDTATALLNTHHRRRATAPEPVDVLDSEFAEQLLVETITTAAESSLPAATDLLSGFDWTGRPALRERLWRELDRYFRMTDAGTDHMAALDVAVDLADSDPYAGISSQQALAAFDQLSTALERRTDALPETTYLSRSHLVAAARQQLATAWHDRYPAVEWVAVDTISVLDNPTLRFFETLARLEDGPELYVFGTRAGAGPRLYDRLESAGLDPDLVEPDEDVNKLHVSGLMAALRGRPPATIPNVEFVAAPDRRRELDHIAERIRALTGMIDDRDRPSTCGDIVVAAKDVIPYRSRIDDVFTDHSIPFHVEARRPLMETAPYRYLRALFDLVAAVADGQSVTAQQLVDPLRLGFQPPNTALDSPREVAWPLDEKSVDDIETGLDTADEVSDDGQPFDDWFETVSTAFPATETAAIRAYLTWVGDTADTAPDSPQAVADLIDDLLAVHLTSTRGGIRQPQGPGVDGTRIGLTTTHASYAVGRLRDQTKRVGSYVDYAIETGLADLGWDLASAAFRNVCGSSSYWPANADANAVRIVNAANAHFREADHVFVLGVAAETFPAERSAPAFLHDGLYGAISAAAREADNGTQTAYLHAPTDAARFESDADEYHAAIAAADESVVVSRRYRTDEGDPVPWSGFVDAYTSKDDVEIDRIPTSEWLPTAGSDDWSTAIRRATPRDRLRLLTATFPDGIDPTGTRPDGSLTNREAIVDLLSRVDGDAYRTEIEPRRRRYRGEDLRSITVGPDTPVSPDSHTPDRGTRPVQPHELDLYAACQLKYYFYTFIIGGGRERAPVSDLPAAYRERYPSEEFTKGLRRLIDSSARLADRQDAFGRYDSLEAFRDQLVSWIERDRSLTPEVIQPMLGEYLAVEQELDAGIDRQWQWEPASTVRIGTHTVRVPAHRVDYVSNYDFSVPVWYTGADGAAEALVSQSLTPTAGGVGDHRLLLGAETVDTFGGTLVCDPTSAAASARQGFLIGDLNPIPEAVPQASNLRGLGRADWREFSSRWLTQTADRLEQLTTTDEPISYRVSDSFVDDGGCVGCAYRDLCGVPASRKRGGR